MTLRFDPSRWLIAPAMALLAVLLGLTAGVDPRIAVTLSLGFAFVIITFSNLPVGLAIFGFLGFIEVVPSGGPFLSVTKLAGLLLALAWLALVTTESGSRANFITAHPAATALIGLFLAWTALSLVWSDDPAAALGASGRFFLDASLFVIVFSAVRNRDHAAMVAGAFLAGAVTAAAYGLVIRPDVNERLGSTVLDPNELAAVLVSGAALAVAVFAVNAKRPGARALAAGGGLFCIAALLLTVSRGGLVSLAVALVAGILVAGRWRLPVAVVILAVACSVVTYYLNFASQTDRDRVTHVTTGQQRIAEGRTSLWQVGWRAFEANPVNGLGAANFRGSSRQFLLQPGLVQRSDEILRGQPVHNAYLEILAELGIVGLGLFLAVVGFSIGSMLKALGAFKQNRDPPMEAFTMAVIVALVGNLAAQFFMSEEYSKQLWLLLGMGPALLAIAQLGRRDAAA
jgi:O-antigen ligase